MQEENKMLVSPEDKSGISLIGFFLSLGGIIWKKTFGKLNEKIKHTNIRLNDFQKACEECKETVIRRPEIVALQEHIDRRFEEQSRLIIGLVGK